MLYGIRVDFWLQNFTVREELKELSKTYDKSEDDLKSLQSGVGQLVGEVLRQLTEDKCKLIQLARALPVQFRAC